MIFFGRRPLLQFLLLAVYFSVTVCDQTGYTSALRNKVDALNMLAAVAGRSAEDPVLYNKIDQLNKQLLEMKRQIEASKAAKFANDTTSTTTPTSDDHMSPIVINGTLYEKVAGLNQLLDSQQKQSEPLLEQKVSDLNQQIDALNRHIEESKAAKRAREEAAKRQAEKERQDAEEAARQAEIARREEEARLAAQRDKEERSQLMATVQAKEREIASLSTTLKEREREIQQMVDTFHSLDQQIENITSAMDRCLNTPPPICPPPLPPPEPMKVVEASFLLVPEPYHSYWTVAATILSAAFVIAWALSALSCRTCIQLKGHLVTNTAVTEELIDERHTLNGELARVKAESESHADAMERLQAELSRTIQEDATEYETVLDATRKFKAEEEVLRARIRSLEDQAIRDGEERALLQSSNLASELQMIGLKGKLSTAEVETSAVKANLTQAQKQVESLKAEKVKEIGALRASVGAAHKSLSKAAEEADRSIKAELETISKRLAETEAATGRFKSLQQDWLGEKHELQSAVKSCEGVVATQLTEIDSLRATGADAAAQYQVEIAQWEKRLLEMQTQGMDAAALHAAQHTVQQATIAQSHEEAIRLQSIIGDLTARLASLQSELQSNQSNLSSLSLAERERVDRLGALEAQGRKDSDEIAALKKQLADAAATADKRISELEVQSKKDSDEIAALKKQLKSIVDENDLAETEITALKKRIANLEVQGKKDTDEIAALKKSTTELEAQVKSITEENDLAEMEVVNLKKHVAELEAQGKKDSAEIAALKKQVDDVSADAAAAKSAAGKDAAAAKTAADKRISELEAQGQKDTVKIAALEKQLADATAAAAATKTAADQDATAAKATADKRISELEAQVDKDVETITTLQLGNGNSTAEVAALKKQLTDAVAAAAIAKTAADRRITDFETQSKKYNDDFTALKKQLADATVAAATAKTTTDKRIAELEGQGMKDTAEIAALKKQLADLDVAAKDTSELAKSIADKSIATLKDDLKKSMDEVVALKKQLADATAAAATAKTATDKRITELEAQGKKDTNEIAALKAQLADLQALQNKTNDELAAMTKKHTDLTKSSEMTKSIADKSIATLKDDLKKSIGEVAALKKQLADATTAAATAKTTADKRIAELEAQGKKDTTEIAALKKQLADLQALQTTTSDELAAMTKKHADARDVSRSLKYIADVSDLEAQGKQDSDEIVTLKQRIAELEAQVKSITEENDLAEMEIVNLKEELVEVIAAVDAQTAKSAEEQSTTFARLRSTIDQLTEELSTQQRREVESAVHYKGEKNQWQSQLALLEGQRKTLETGRDGMLAKISRLELEIKLATERAMSVANDRDNLSDKGTELKTKLSTLRERAASAEKDRDALLIQNSELEQELSAMSKRTMLAEQERIESESRSWFRRAVSEEKAVTQARYDQSLGDLAVAQAEVAELKRHVVEITMKRVQEEDRHQAEGIESSTTIASLKRQLKAVKEEAFMMEERIDELHTQSTQLYADKVALVAKNATCELLILSLENRTSGSSSLTPLSKTPLKNKMVSLEARLQQFETMAGEDDQLSSAIESIKTQLMATKATKMGGDGGSMVDDDRSPSGVTVTAFALGDLQALGRAFGSGTFGRVSLVRERVTKKVYALKTMLKTEIVAHKQQNNVLNEKNIMMACHHPFILRLYQTFKDARKLYMLIEFVQGGELFGVVHTARSDGVPDSQAKFYAAGIILALGYLHKKDIAYRDLKPENCLIDAAGYPKLIDFGFAKVLTGSSKTYTLCGTPEYLAPEQVIESEGHTCAVDYWAFGILLYEMVSGVSPFAIGEDTPHSILFDNIVRGKVQHPLSDYTDNTLCADLVSKLLVREPLKRLGNVLSRGVDDVIDHPFFESIDFDQFMRKKTTAPWVPKVTSIVDTSHFDIEGVEDHPDFDDDDDEEEEDKEEENSPLSTNTTASVSSVDPTGTNSARISWDADF